MPHRPPRLAHTLVGRFSLALVGTGLFAVSACAPPAEELDTSDDSAAVNEITIRGQDYAFEMPEPVPAGMVHFSFENVGEVSHEVVVVELLDGVTADQIGEALQGTTDPATLMEGVVGILIADPGETAIGGLVVEMEAGRTYALLCNLRDTDDAPPHIALGMVRIFQAT